VYVLDIWEADLARRIKAADPNAVVLAYKDLSAVLVNSSTVVGGHDGELLPAGVGFVDADTNHPDWFLLDRSGDRLGFEDYPGNWQMDVGNAGYQARWAANVIADLRGQGSFDGVFMDDVLTRAGAHHESQTPAKYPTDAALQGATRSMLAAVAPSLRAAGYLSFANIPGAYEYPGLWKDWLGLLDGAFEENFAVWGSERVADWGSNGWRAHLEEINEASRQGKWVLFRADVSSGDREALRYALGTYLLADHRYAAFAVGDTVKWQPEYDWVIGEPQGPATEIQHSVLRRDFSLGVVIVNANASKSVDVDLGGTYIDESGNPVSSVSIGATRARILRAG
jgi:hypothetical protein